MMVAFIAAIGVEQGMVPEGSLKIVLDSVIKVLAGLASIWILWKAIRWAFGPEKKKGLSGPPKEK
jgi:hypothetical protein